MLDMLKLSSKECGKAEGKQKRYQYAMLLFWGELSIIE
jgi:hypothetical protein